MPGRAQGQKAYQAVFLLGLGLYLAAFGAGLGYALKAGRHLPGIDAHHLTLADDLARRGELKGATREYRMATLLDPNDEEAARRLMDLEARQGGKASAQVDFYTRQRDLQPLNAASHRNLAQALYASGRYEEAVAAYSAALHLEPRDARAHAGIGEVRLDQDRLDEAAQAFTEAIARDPAYAPAHNGLGIVAALKGDQAAAVAHFEQAERLQPGVYADNLTKARAALAGAGPSR